MPATRGRGLAGSSGMIPLMTIVSRPPTAWRLLRKAGPGPTICSRAQQPASPRLEATAMPLLVTKVLCLRLKSLEAGRVSEVAPGISDQSKPCSRP